MKNTSDENPASIAIVPDQSASALILIGMMLVLVSTATPFSMFSLLIESMAQSLQVPSGQSGLLFGISGIGAAFGWFVGGWLLQYVPRRIVFVLLLVLEMISLLAIAGSWLWTMVLPVLFVLGVCQCGALSAALATVVDMNRSRAVSNGNFLTASNLVLPIFPALAGVFLREGGSWRSVLILSTLPLVLALCWVLALRLPSPPARNSAPLMTFREAIRFPGSYPIMTLFVIAGFSFAIVPGGWMGVMGQQVFGRGDLAAGATSLILLTVGLGQIGMGCYARYRSIRWPIVFCSAVLAMVCLGLPLARQAWQYWLIISLMGLFGGFLQPCCLALAEGQLGREAHRSIGVLGLWGEGGSSVLYYLTGLVAAWTGGLANAMGGLAVCALIVALVAGKLSTAKKIDEQDVEGISMHTCSGRAN